MIHVLVTGGNGQLASSLKDLEKQYSKFSFIYTDCQNLDITNSSKILDYFKQNPQFDFCINCAAYTAVDKAEEEEEKAYLINAEGAKNLAIACSQNNVTLIHISTDFVFDGNKPIAYKETDNTNPISIYGSTKLHGENQVLSYTNEYFILRTSWLYSEHGNNFMKTMIKLAENRDELSIVGDQIGTPTYATDLAKMILEIITQDCKEYGVYHYSNEGVASWYDFAKAIFALQNLSIKTHSIKTTEYPTPAKRPIFSVLDKTKIKNTLKVEIPYWRDSLIIALQNFNDQQ